MMVLIFVYHSSIRCICHRLTAKEFVEKYPFIKLTIKQPDSSNHAAKNTSRTCRQNHGLYLHCTYNNIKNPKNHCKSFSTCLFLVFFPEFGRKKLANMKTTENMSALEFEQKTIYAGGTCITHRSGAP